MWCRVTLCLQDIEFLHNVLTLFGHVTLTDGSADLLNRCSDLLTNFLEKILLFQHACNCCSAEQPVAEKDGDKGPGTTDSNRTPRIPRFLSKVVSLMPAIHCLLRFLSYFLWLFNRDSLLLCLSNKTSPVGPSFLCHFHHCTRGWDCSKYWL